MGSGRREVFQQPGSSVKPMLETATICQAGQEVRAPLQGCELRAPFSIFNVPKQVCGGARSRLNVFKTVASRWAPWSRGETQFLSGSTAWTLRSGCNTRRRPRHGYFLMDARRRRRVLPATHGLKFHPRGRLQGKSSSEPGESPR